MITIEEEVRGVIEEIAGKTKVSLIRTSGCSNAYTVMAVDPATRERVAEVRVNTGSPRWNAIHFWINQDRTVIGARTGNPYSEGGAYASVGDADAMRRFRDHVTAAFLAGRKVFLPEVFPEFPVAGHPARVADRDGSDLILELSRYDDEQRKYLFASDLSIELDGDDEMLWPIDQVSRLQAS